MKSYKELNNKQIEAQLKSIKHRISHETITFSLLDRDIAKWMKNTPNSQLKKIELQEEKWFKDFLKHKNLND
jgi:hypothetical protein